MKARLRSSAAGFSLIELMVSMVIGLVITVAIANVMVGSEKDKRGSTAVNDASQSGSYAAYVLDRQIRSAGSGYAQKWAEMIGCTLYAQNAGGQLLPRSAAFAASSPFAGWAAPITLAPVIVGKDLAPGSGGDLLLVQTGTAGLIEQPAALLPGIGAGQIRLNNSLGFRGGDLLLLADSTAPVAGKCMVQQIAAGFSGSTAQLVPLGGDYAVASIGSSSVVSVTSYATGTTALAAQLGNVNGNMPQFSLIGVGANSALVSTELLPLTGGIDETGQSIADDVVEMRALYGISTPTGPGFVAPDSTGFAVADLTAGAAAQANLRKIVSIRLGLVLRTSVGEPTPVYPSTAKLSLFNGLTDAITGLSLASTPRAIGAGAGPYFRYRSLELTIPLRNVMAAP